MDVTHAAQQAKAIPAGLAARYEADGFVLAPPIIPAALVNAVVPRMDAVVAGTYETGNPPHALHFGPDDPPEKLKKIDDAHLCDRTIYAVVTHPALGRWAAAVTGASRIQVWATQLLVKPPSAQGAALGGTVGWHQDKQYWPFWEGEAFTAWVAISNVRAASGAMRFVRGSHRWGLLDQGDFFGDPEAQRAGIAAPEGQPWEEVIAELAPGAVSFHHRLTFHASGPNCETTPRRSFAIHMRTEKSRPIAENYYTTRLDDPVYRPVIYEA